MKDAVFLYDNRRRTLKNLFIAVTNHYWKIFKRGGAFSQKYHFNIELFYINE